MFKRNKQGRNRCKRREQTCGPRGRGRRWAGLRKQHWHIPRTKYKAAAVWGPGAQRVELAWCPVTTWRAGVREAQGKGAICRYVVIISPRICISKNEYKTVKKKNKFQIKIKLKIGTRPQYQACNSNNLAFDKPH